MKRPGSSQAAKHMRKVVGRGEAIRVAQKAHREGKKVVTTNGVFDLLHVGHIRALSFARTQGDLLVVGINSDASVRRNKGYLRPVVPARERAELLAALESVDYVFVFSEKEPSPWIRQIRPHVHVKGSEYTRTQIIELPAVEKGGGRVKLAPHIRKHSTTDIIKKIQAVRNPESK